jgi:hypothetical protein
MHTFRETRWQTPLAWLLFSVLATIGGNLARHPMAKGLLFVGAVIAAGYALYRAISPRAVIKLDSTNIWICGVRPGWWKFVQLPKSVELRNHDVLEIKIGKIRGKSGMFPAMPPIGEPSRGALFQRFLWIRYTSTSGTREIYYPDLGNIHNTRGLIEILKENFGNRVLVFN